jgi:Zn-dependent peptidase ImmA (M78 family)
MDLYNLLNGDITEIDLLNYHNASITYLKLPKKIYGFVFLYRGIYNIFVDENISYNKKKETILHELAHIELNQLDQVDNDLLAFKVNKYEDDADRYVKFLIN